MADASTDETRLADSIIEKVAQEQAYQDLQDRLKSVEEECRNERAEKDKIKAERDELGMCRWAWPLGDGLPNSSRLGFLTPANSYHERPTSRSQFFYPIHLRYHLFKRSRL